MLTTREELKREKSSLPLLIILSEYKPLLLLFVRNGRHLSQQIKQPVMYTLALCFHHSLSLSSPSPTTAAAASSSLPRSYCVH